MRLKQVLLLGSLFPFLLAVTLFFGVLVSADNDDSGGDYSSGITGMNLSAEVLKHQPMVEKYAKEYGISEYVNILLAIIQVESGGTAEDVMQSSESLGLPPNSLDTESSIKQGCKYFASLLSSCKEQGITDINVAETFVACTGQDVAGGLSRLQGLRSSGFKSGFERKWRDRA